MVISKGPHRSAQGGKKPHARNLSNTNAGLKESQTDRRIANDSAPAASSSTPRSPTVDGLPSRTIAQLRNATIAHPQQQCTLTCYIPPSKVGAVIGRKGSTIEKIQKEAKRKSWGHSGPIRVSVVSQGATSRPSGSSRPSPEDATDKVNHAYDNETNTTAAVEMDDSHLWTPVVIRGDPCACFAAAKLIVPLVSSKDLPVSGSIPIESDGNEIGPNVSTEETKRNAKMTTALDYDPTDMDDVVLDVPIPRPCHSAIIGRKGLTIAALSADHAVRIMVPHVTSTASNIDVIQLEGELEQVERCLAAIMLVVSTHQGVDSAAQETKVAVVTAAEPLKQQMDSLKEVEVDVDTPVTPVETVCAAADDKTNRNHAQTVGAIQGRKTNSTHSKMEPSDEKFGTELGILAESDPSDISQHEAPEASKKRIFSGRGGRGRARGRGRGRGRVERSGR
jgi:predicted RNA-binding protein YlqC (UPF0109 family)